MAAHGRKAPRLPVKLPDSPAALSLASPYPDLQESWHEDEREWGWTLHLVDVIPDLRPAVTIAERFHPTIGPAFDAADREQVREQLRSGLTPRPDLHRDGRQAGVLAANDAIYPSEETAQNEPSLRTPRDEVVRQREVSQIVRQVIADGISSRDFDIPDPGAAAIAVLSLCLDVARWYRPGHRLTPQQLGDFNAIAALRIVGDRLA